MKTATFIKERSSVGFLEREWQELLWQIGPVGRFALSSPVETGVMSLLFNSLSFELSPLIDMSSAEKDKPVPRVQRRFSRCPVVPEESSASLQIGRKTYQVVLQDKSIDGFSILMKPRDARQATLGEVWTLRTVSEKAYVTAQWVYQHPDGDVQFGLRRIQELHKKMASGVFPVWLGKRRRSLNPDVLVGVLVIAAILVIAMPGVADRLGAADWIQGAFKNIRESVLALIANRG